MATAKRNDWPQDMGPEPDHGEIVVHAIIARVPYRMGDGPSAIGAAFAAAGEYVAEQARLGMPWDAEAEFTLPWEGGGRYTIHGTNE